MEWKHKMVGRQKIKKPKSQVEEGKERKGKWYTYRAEAPEEHQYFCYLLI